MGVVYLGHGPSDPIRPSRPVAVKTMGQHLFSDPKEGARFLREAKIAAQIQHPNVVATLDVIEQAGNVWHVMEFVNGASAHAILRVDRELGRRIPVGVALRIFVDVLRGIAGAYDAQRPDGRPLRIVHRDISPQNVLVSEEDGVARVLDFGIAKTATHETTADSAGIRGKVRYIAPEQIKGLSAVHQSDIYSACVVAWELLAGRALFDGETLPVIVTRVLLGEIPRLRELRPDVPEALEALLRRGLSGDIRMRPRSSIASASQSAPRSPPTRLLARARKPLSAQQIIARSIRIPTQRLPHPASDRPPRPPG
jgi:serine/threonine-protein kinase